MYIFVLLFAIGNVGPSLQLFSEKITNNDGLHPIPDGGHTVIFCLLGNSSVTSRKWEVFGNTLGEPTKSSDANNHSNFNVSGNSSLIVTNPREGSLKGFVNVTCIANLSVANISVANKTDKRSERILFQLVFYKAPKITNRFVYDVPDNGTSKTVLHCDTNGFPEPSIKWSFDNTSLLSGRVHFVNTTEIANANFTLINDGSLQVLSKNRRDGFGVNVVCTANNSAGNTNQTFLVRFLKAPKILSDNFFIPLIEGEVKKVWIPCPTSGYPRPAIRWEFGEKVLNSSSGLVKGPEVAVSIGKTVTSSFQVYENGSLLINNPYYREHLPYENFTCIATSFLGTDRKKHEILIGKLKSFTFEIVLANATFIRKATEIINNATFKANLSFRWFNVTNVNDLTGMVRFSLSWLEQDLKLKYVAKDDGGEDRTDVAAIARAVYEQLQLYHVPVARFLMHGEPGPATDLSVNEATLSEITFSWKPPSYFTVTSYQVQIKDDGSAWKNIKQVPRDKTSTTLEELESGTTYLIRLEAKNGQKTGLPSKVLEAKTEDTLPTAIIVVIVIIVILAVLLLVLGIVYYRRRPKRTTEIIGLVEERNPYEYSLPGIPASNVYIEGNRTRCAYHTVDIPNKSAEQEYFSWREIPRDSLIMGDTLGQGEFGLVVKAMWNDQEKNTHLPVAVKTIKENATETDRKELFKELRLMAEISEHPNVVNLIGACSREGPLWVIVELCENGNLLSFLRKNRQEISERTGDFVSALDPLVRVRIAYDVSKGMHYLEEKKIVHRDLAARNVLLGRNKIAKIADFGLSRDIYEVGLYQKQTGGKLPVKWMAIESLKEATYTSKSDVWSFGVLFWEIETAGVVPYPGIGGRDLLGFLSNGFRLEKPSETPFEIYEIMKKCWEPSPKVRPHFAEIESQLEAYLEERTDYLPVLIEEETADDDQLYVNYIVDLEEEDTSL